jgi:predicted membrane channel-forming protein YqfA (hemolysin III family)
MILITSSSLICFCSSLHPLFDGAKMRPIRGYMFIILGLSAALPFTYIAFDKSNTDKS